MGAGVEPREGVGDYRRVLMMNFGTSPLSRYRRFNDGESEPKRRILFRHAASPQLQRMVQMSSSPRMVE